MSIHNADLSRRYLSEVVPLDVEAPVKAWLAGQVERQCMVRDEWLHTMRLLGVGGVELVAYKEATDDLREMARRWSA